MCDVSNSDVNFRAHRKEYGSIDLVIIDLDPEADYGSQDRAS